MHPFPVLVVSAIDPRRLEDAAAALLRGPNRVGLGYRYDQVVDRLVRTVRRGAGPGEVELVPLTGCCLSCSIRSDLATVLPSFHLDQPEAVVVFTPPAVDPVPIVAGVLDLEVDGGFRMAAAITVVAPAELPTDLFGTDLLAERDLALSESDRRSVGEVLARQVETADLLVITGRGSRTGAVLLEHLSGSDRPRIELAALDDAVPGLLRQRSAACDRADLRRLEWSGATDGADVWTLDLSTWKPFHPERLLTELERLGGGRLRGRGIFWLASRPHTRCAWDGAGGQLSVGAIGEWDAPPVTRLILTGMGRGAGRVQRAYTNALLTDRELARGLPHWLPVDGDGWEPWLGPCGAPALTEYED